MDKDTKKELDRIMAATDNPEIEQEVQDAIVSDPMLELKNTLLGFFSNRLSKIKEKEVFLRKVQDAIEKKIDSTPDMKINELLSIYKSISMEMGVATEAILSLFRPSKDGVVTPLLTGEKRSDKMDEAFSGSDPETARKVDALFRLVNQMSEKEKE